MRKIDKETREGLWALAIALMEYGTKPFSDPPWDIESEALLQAQKGTITPDRLVVLASYCKWSKPQLALLIAADVLRDRYQIVALHVNTAKRLFDGTPEFEWVAIDHPILMKL